MVLAAAEPGDWILCQITSKSYGDARAVELTDTGFDRGSLRLVSYARPAKPLTAHESLFVSEVGVLRYESLKKIADEVISVIQPDGEYRAGNCSSGNSTTRKECGLRGTPMVTPRAESRLEVD